MKSAVTSENQSQKGRGRLQTSLCCGFGPHLLRHTVSQAPRDVRKQEKGQEF